MMQSLHTSATGIIAMQKQVDTTAHNIANANTVGFKRSRVEFADLVYKGGEGRVAGADARPSVDPGLGVRTMALSKIFSDGNIKRTDNRLDIAITGRGFLKFKLPDGTQGYSRNGALRLDAKGFIVNSDGHRVLPEIDVPDNATLLSIASDGVVRIKRNSDSKASYLGQLKLSGFANPAGLRPTGENLYVQTVQSGKPRDQIPGSSGMGHLHQGFLELSNVQLVVELSALITGQRAYNAISKVITVSDEMLKTVTSLKRQYPIFA